MTTQTSTFGRTGFSGPRLTWRGLLARVAAFDVLYRERAKLAELDDHILRDIGATRADVAGALREPDAHLRLIVMRRGYQFEN